MKPLTRGAGHHGRGQVTLEVDRPLGEAHRDGDGQLPAARAVNEVEFGGYAVGEAFGGAQEVPDRVEI